MLGLLLSSDLMFGSKATSAARAAGREMGVTGSPAAALQQVASADIKLVILDLTTAGLNAADLVPSLKETEAAPFVIAFAPHVMSERIKNAKTAGCDLVLTRGQFDRDISALLTQYL